MVVPPQINNPGIRIPPAMQAKQTQVISNFPPLFRLLIHVKCNKHVVHFIIFYFKCLVPLPFLDHGSAVKTSIVSTEYRQATQGTFYITFSIAFKHPRLGGLLGGGGLLLQLHCYKPPKLGVVTPRRQKIMSRNSDP